ncbi:hypothetical protein DI272_18910 [Streptomyces sp. Act143]|uniref:hypothetical protein n=1 Tax=Streptomyces sp. Act143 TaxID=2200760 RepID=UPI000D681F84|nr:hypothetical protein [Streptomyces sp. Act143]PWI16004.1 hypothetical protein DI272_18910 [Streptomyces sp. Act143]
MKDRIIEILTNLGGTRIEDEGKAREALATESRDMTRSLTPYSMRKAMEKTADAMPWRLLLEEQGDDDPIEVFLKLRKRLTKQLVGTTSSSSSCTISNEQDRLKWDGIRRFLQDTDCIVSALEAAERAANEPAPEPTPEPESKSEPAKPVPARRPTPAQRKGLELIAQGGVKRTQFGLRNRERIGSENGTIYADTFEVLLRERWVTLDSSKSLFQGQPIELTEAGRAHLPA